MEFIPAKLEYLFLVGLYAIILAALLDSLVLILVRDKIFWASFLLFETTWVLLDRYGPAHGLWIFQYERLCGITVLGVPLEEHAVFLLVHATAIGGWHHFGARHDVE